MKEDTQSKKSMVEKPRPLAKAFNDIFLCPICRGYLVDATTIAECPHSFCRSCITKKLRNGSKSCPVCGEVIKSPPVTDITLQRLIYSTIPGLYLAEQERRRQFHEKHPNCAGTQNTVLPPMGTPKMALEDPVSLSLSQIDTINPKVRDKEPKDLTRYLMCPAGVTIRHLKRLLLLKRGWNESDTSKRIELLYLVDGVDLRVLDPSWTLLHMTSIFDWKRDAPLKLLYRIVNVVNIKPPTLAPKSNGYQRASIKTVESIPKPMHPFTSPTSPRLIITKILDSKNKRAAESSPNLVVKKPRCEVTPVLRSPEPHFKITPSVPTVVLSSKIEESPVKSDHHKRKKRHTKRLIGEITRTAPEDLKLKVRLTPCPPKVSVQKKDKMGQSKTVRREKVRSPTPPPAVIKRSEDLAKDTENSANKPVVPDEAPKTPPKNEDVLRRLGLVGIEEANKAIEERNRNNSNLEPKTRIEREKLEKRLRESKANRKRSLMAEKRLRDTMKSIMSTNINNNDINHNDTSNQKKKDPPPLTPLRNNKRPGVTFAPVPYVAKCDSSVEVTRISPKTNALDLTIYSRKLMKDNKPTGILRTHVSKFVDRQHRTPTDCPPNNPQRKIQELNLKTLSDAAVSLIDERNAKKMNSALFKNCNGNANILRIPQPYPSMTNLGIKIKPNQGVRHIPNPQAIVASNHFRNQRPGFYGLSAHQST